MPFPLVKKEKKKKRNSYNVVISWFVKETFARVSGVNIGGAGSYVYDNPVNEAPAAVSLETDGKPEEAKKAPARGPVKGEKYVEQK